MHQWTIRAAQVALVAAAFSAAGAGVAGATTDPDPAYAPQMDICGNAIANSGGVGTATCKGQAKIGDDDDAAPVAPAMHAWSAKPETVMPSIGAPNAGVGAAGEPVTTSAAPAEPAEPAAESSITKAPVEKAPTAKAPEKAPAAMPPAATPATAPDKAMAPSVTQAEAPSIAPAVTQAEAPSTAPAEAPSTAPAEAPSTPPSMTQAEVPSTPPSMTEAEAPEQIPPAAPEIAPSATAMQASVAEPAPEMMTSGENGLLSGNQVKAPVRIPIRICGNAGALGGMATASCEGTASSGHFAGMHHAYRVAGLLG
jgi:hypothetical protein